MNISANPNATNSEMDAKVILKYDCLDGHMNIRTRQELIGNNLMNVICDYPDQIRPILDELVSHLNHTQLDEIEDLIVNNYCEEV
tara:strand:- start:221 stop:475 length:255 start_codon:yes stop_codon:yes gene_type:complete